MLSLKSIIANILDDYSSKIRTGTCELSEEDALQLISNIAHIKLTKKDAAERLNISERTFDRKINNGELPVGKKTIGETKLTWFLDELEKYKK